MRSGRRRPRQGAALQLRQSSSSLWRQSFGRRVVPQQKAAAFGWMIDQFKAPGFKLIGSYLLMAYELFRCNGHRPEAAGAFAVLIIQYVEAPPRDSSGGHPGFSSVRHGVLRQVGAGMDLSVINPADPAARSALIVAGFLFVIAIMERWRPVGLSSPSPPTSLWSGWE